jgi:hypothetical protein
MKYYFRELNNNKKYYFNIWVNLLTQVESLRKTQDNINLIQWSVNINPSGINDLVCEYWTTETKGTDIPLKCKGYLLCGYITINNSNENILDILPMWELDYTNRFIEMKYLTDDDLKGLSKDELLKCKYQGGIILNKI